MRKNKYTFLAAWSGGGVEGIEKKWNLFVASEQTTSEA